ncbi:MAG: hypothetical protein GX851_04560, partial [Clostridiales bacterium]|nr:hypothetical protein [Clostridiales bacterium]
MRGFFIKLALSLSLVAVLTFYPLKTISDMLETDKNYKNILLNMRYLPLELYYNDRRADYAVYRISESEPEKLYDTIFKEVSQMDCFGFMGIINMNPVFVSSFYLNVGEPELEYSEVKIGDITHKNVSVKNGRELKSENGKSISSYTVFDFFAQNDLLEIVSGRMLDCEKDYDRGDTVEVVVTSGIGCSVGDILYISLNAMDESYTQVLIRAEVTGIAEKGVFLPSYPGYDLH